MDLHQVESLVVGDAHVDDRDRDRDHDRDHGAGVGVDVGAVVSFPSFFLLALILSTNSLISCSTLFEVSSQSSFCPV